jgi:predicted regulator of amino acid metabolism with ACT domain
MNILNEILSECTHHMGFIKDSAKTKNRKKELVFVRNLYFKFARMYTTYSTVQIGMIVKRDHATVLHGLETIENDLAQYEDLRNISKKIEHSVKNIVQNDNLSALQKTLNNIEEIQKLLLDLKENYITLSNELQAINLKN